MDLVCLAEVSHTCAWPVSDLPRVHFNKIVRCTNIRDFISQKSRICLVKYLRFVHIGLPEGQILCVYLS